GQDLPAGRDCRRQWLYGRAGCGTLPGHEITGRMIYLELLDLRMHAYHGLYEGEEVVGSPYIVNLRVGYEDAAGPAEEPAQLIDYAALYEIIRKRMEIRQGLLEKVCEGIVGR